jgi:hypothetical protein
MYADTAVQPLDLLTPAMAIWLSVSWYVFVHDVAAQVEFESKL